MLSYLHITVFIVFSLWAAIPMEVGLIGHAGSIVVLEKRPTSVSQTAQGSSLLLLKANSRETEVGVDACELGDSLNSIITQKQ